MLETASYDHDLGLADLLEVLASGARADGVLVSSTSASGEPVALAALPSGLAGRWLPFSAALLATCDQGILPTADLLLPSMVTSWLGFRPGYIASVKINWTGGEGCLFFWWKDQPAEHATLSSTMTRAARLVAEFAARQATAQALQQMQDRLDAVLENVSLGIVFLDSLRGSLLNPFAAEMLHLPVSTRDAATVVAAMQQIRATCRVETAESVSPALATAVSAEYWVCADRDLVLRVESHSVGNAQTPGRFWIFTDVKPLWNSAEKVKSANRVLERNLVQLSGEMERRMEAEATLRKYTLGLKQQNEELEIAKLKSDLLANQDPLTGLANRRRFRHGLEDMLEEARAKGSRVAVLYLDLDKFKQVNDTLGHERGDELLHTVADTLTKVLRKDDLIARLGGDEFGCALHLAAESNGDGLNHLVALLCSRLNIPVEGATKTIHVSATIGMAVYPGDADDAASLVRAADNAMYLGKRQGGNDVVVFSRKVNSSLETISLR